MERKCFLCDANGSRDPLDRHHIFGGANRKKSEKYGLVVDLCHFQCHIFGPFSVHKNASVMRQLHIYGQSKAMQEQGWTIAEFVKHFGKNYLDEEW